jgi:hypothetical protein
MRGGAQGGFLDRFMPFPSILRTLALVLALIGAGLADEGMWSLGLRTQGTVDFAPGQDWFTGPEVGYSNYYMASHKLVLKACYLTSRMEQVFRPNIIRQDYYLFTPQWHFRRGAFFDPVVQVDLGYSHYDIENEAIFGDVLDNNTLIAAAQAGLAVNLAQGRYGLFYHLGYNFITPQSSLVFPGVFGLGLWFML